ATRIGRVLAYRLWLTLSVTLTASASGGDVNTATRFAASYRSRGGRSGVGAASGLAATATPARRNASMNSARANAAGSSTGQIRTIGLHPAAIRPRTENRCFPVD